MENNKFKENFIPAIVLLSICLCATLALAAVHFITQPLIDQNAVAAANEARALVLPEGDGFTEYDGKLLEGIDDCFIADNGAGMAVTSHYKGFGGDVKVMTGINAEGKVTGVTVTEHSETPGLGTKDMEPDYLAQYKDVSEIAQESIGDDPDIDAVTGATITANAIYNAVGEALAQFESCGGVK